MASLPLTAASLNISLNYSSSTGLTSGWQQKIVAKNPDGTVKDFTGYTSLTIYLNAGTLKQPALTANATIVVGTADATGIVAEIDEATGSAIVNSMTVNNTAFSIKAGNGTDIAIIATGQLSMKLLP